MLLKHAARRASRPRSFFFGSLRNKPLRPFSPLRLLCSCLRRFAAQAGLTAGCVNVASLHTAHVCIRPVKAFMLLKHAARRASRPRSFFSGSFRNKPLRPFSPLRLLCSCCRRFAAQAGLTAGCVNVASLHTAHVCIRPVKAFMLLKHAARRASRPRSFFSGSFRNKPLRPFSPLRLLCSCCRRFAAQVGLTAFRQCCDDSLAC